MALLLALHGDELHWDEIANAARRFGVLPALKTTLIHVHQVWGAPIPNQAQLYFGAEEASIGAKLGMIVQTARRPDVLILREGLSYKGGRHKFLYFFHFFFPSQAYMRTRYGISHSILMPFYYLWRLFLGARRLVESVWSILGNAIRMMRQSRKG